MGDCHSGAGLYGRPFGPKRAEPGHPNRTAPVFRIGKKGGPLNSNVLSPVFKKFHTPNPVEGAAINRVRQGDPTPTTVCRPVYGGKGDGAPKLTGTGMWKNHFTWFANRFFHAGRVATNAKGRGTSSRHSTNDAVNVRGRTRDQKLIVFQPPRGGLQTIKDTCLGDWKGTKGEKKCLKKVSNPNWTGRSNDGGFNCPPFGGKHSLSVS